MCVFIATVNQYYTTTNFLMETVVDCNISSSEMIDSVHVEPEIRAMCIMVLTINENR